MADIYNTANDTLLSGTSKADSIQNGGVWDGSYHYGGSNVTIDAGAGNDSIYNNYGSDVTINAGAGNDSIYNDFGSNVTINAGDGSDSISNSGGYVSISTGDGDDSIQNNSGSFVTINAGAGSDSISNSGGYVTINAGAGDDSISNESWWNGYQHYPDNVTINAGSGNDSIRNNNGSRVMINAGAGNDSIENYSSNVTINAGAGNDRISLTHSGNLIQYAAGDGNDTLWGFNESETLTITGGSYSTQVSGSDVLVKIGSGSILLVGAKGKDLNINRKKTPKLITLTDSNDTFSSTLSSVKIIGGKGSDYINAEGANNSIDGGAGDDTIESYGFNVSINAGAGNDYISNYSDGRGTIIAGTGDDNIYNDGMSVIIDGGAGDDSINNYGDNVTINAGAGNDYIYNRGDSVTINAGTGNDSIYNDSWNGGDTLTGGEGADFFFYGADADSITSVSNDIITDYEEKDTIRFNIIVDKVSVNSAGHVIFNVGYNKLLVKNAADKFITYIDGDGLTKTFGKKKFWTLDGTTATYGDLTVKGVTSLDGLSLSGKILTVSAASLGTKDVTISDGYTLALGDDVDGSTKKKSWSLRGSTATYKHTTSAGYSLEDNSIVYTKKSSKTPAKVKGVNDKSGLKVSGKTIKLAGSSLASKVTVSGDYTFDFASDYSKATITGSSSDDTIIARGKNILVKGGKGSDVFALRSTGTINDYAEEDKISLSSAAEISVSGDDVIFNGKVTVAGAADKSITYIEDGAEKVFKYTPAAV
ncbi:MAG: calcium-binding protein, partial [Selenomonadaceae bacterium]|nr:calcium-binding protein [Selenomonadaceae bacterium]